MYHALISTSTSEKILILFWICFLLINYRVERSLDCTEYIVDKQEKYLSKIFFTMLSWNLLMCGSFIEVYVLF